MKKYFLQIISHTIILTLLFGASVSFAQSQLVTCTKANCDYNDLLIQIKTLINFAFTYLVIPLMIFLVLKAGFTYLTSGGDSSAHKKARTTFTNAVIGFLIALCAWLIVKVLIEYLNKDAEFKVDTFF